ncbi:MAG: MBL fold metallo-hydrolase [Chitinophagales bacterium]
MKITFLGTGTSMGVPVIGCDCEVCLSSNSKDKRLRTSIAIEVDGQNLVVDTGPDFRQQMLNAGIVELAAVLFTHDHKDHTAGLDDVRAYNHRNKTDMHIYLTDATETSLKMAFPYAFPSENKYPGAPDIVPHRIDAETPFEVNGLRIVPIEVIHGKMPVLGFRFGDFTYITDAKYIVPKELDKIRGSKVVVFNTLKKEEHWSHLTLEEALALVAELKPERAYFTHLSHRMGLHEVIQSELPENVFLAYDGLEILVD